MLFRSWCNENKLQSQVDFLRSNPDYVLTHGEMLFLNGATNEITKPEPRTNVPEGDVHRAVFTQHIANTSTVLFRRSALSDVNLQDWLDFGFGVDDIGLWVYMAQKGKFHFTPTCDVVYLVAAESVCHSNQLSKRVKYMARRFSFFSLCERLEAFQLSARHSPKNVLESFHVTQRSASHLVSSESPKRPRKTKPPAGLRWAAV